MKNMTQEQQKQIRAKREQMIKDNPKVLEWMKDPKKLSIINYFAAKQAGVI